MAQNIIEKIWDAHIVKQKPGHPAIFGIDLQLIHEVTSPQAFALLRKSERNIKFLNRCVATLDHSIPTREDRLIIFDTQAATQVKTLRDNVKDFGVTMYDFESGHQGIVHVIGPELGLTQPGMTIVCGDSHTSTHGAFGALAFGVGTTEVGLVMMTGCILREKPKTMKVVFDGTFQPGVYPKDAILALIAEIGIGGANGYIIEYTGSAVRNMSMEERMTICNMSIECGARAGLVSPDQITFDYIRGRTYAPSEERWQEAISYWSSFISDDNALFDREISLDIDQLTPMVTWGINPGQGMPLHAMVPNRNEIDDNELPTYDKAIDYVQLTPGAPIQGMKIDFAFLGSCTNSRLPDLRIAAEMLRGRKIADHVTMYVVPGSEQVKAEAEKEGLDQIFLAAGAKWRNPGCSMCLGMNDDKVPTGKRCISSSNRNFIGRQGPGSITHLASPATVVASAIAGSIQSSNDIS